MTEDTRDKPAAASTPSLLTGDNPQIPKGYGDAPVKAYIAAVPGWKHTVCAQLDALITTAVPDARKAVKWNTPLYGVADPEGGWFVGFHCFTRYVKVTFFRGAALDPVPPGASKQADVRYLDIYEDAPFDADQFTAWVIQASRLPGAAL